MSLQGKVQTFLVGIFVLMTSGIIYLSYNSEKKFVEKVIQEQTHEAVDQYFDSVNTLMISGAMDQREVLRMKAMQRENIVEARIIRSKAVVDTFGEGLEHEHPKDEIEKKALEGEAYQKIVQFDNKRTLTVITPFRASSNFRGTNCIECHQVDEGTVLGAVKISYSLEKLDQEIKNNAIFTGKIMFGLFFIALMLIAFMMRVLVIGRVKKFNQALTSIAKNFDLTLRLKEPNNKDEISEMTRSFNSMIERFHGAMKDINETCEKITTGSETIYALTQKTQKEFLAQQGETSSVASAVTEMNSTAKIVADNAMNTQHTIEVMSLESNTGATKAQSAHEKIDYLSEKVNAVGIEIEKISKQGEEIEKILKMIGEITTRTTMLSFNASIEAARAGAHGQGFTVVAEEIGELSKQTRRSTDEIKKITLNLNTVIQESIEVMEATKIISKEGQDYVFDSTNSLKKIAEDIGKVNMMASSISSAAKEQSIAADAVDSSLQSIMDLTASSVESANEMKQVGVELNEIAGRLKELVASFKI